MAGAAVGNFSRYAAAGDSYAAKTAYAPPCRYAAETAYAALDGD